MEPIKTTPAAPLTVEPLGGCGAMNTKLTRQEELFLDRMADYLVDAGSLDEGSLKAAGEAVLIDDQRLIGLLFRSESFRAAASRHLQAETYRAIRGDTLKK